MTREKIKLVIMAGMVLLEEFLVWIRGRRYRKEPSDEEE